MISVVIPTLNRPASLARTLRAIAAQSRAPDEVIVVTGAADSDDIAAAARLAGQDVTIIESVPSVCVQRNLGIRYARSSWIWLCDDDIEAPPNYLEEICRHLTTSPGSGAVTGLVAEQTDDGSWQSEHGLRHGRSVVLHWLFQLSIWGPLPPAERLGALARVAQRRLLAAGNGLSHAGWPVNIDFSAPVTRVAVYGLGAAVVRRDWLLVSPYDESLSRNGIGDNYGVALGFPCANPPPPAPDGPARAVRPSLPIEVLTHISVKHHRSTSGRMNAAQAHELRVKALALFVGQHCRFKWRHRSALLWSLLGLTLLALARGRVFDAADNLRLAIGTGRRLARPGADNHCA